MIQVTIYRNEKEECSGFLARGHAGFSEEGQDELKELADLYAGDLVEATGKLQF